MLAHYHGQTWNGSELARSMGITDKTVRGYLDILTGTHMIRQLQPWHENLKKRQVKAPKIYFRDSGLLHSFLSLPTWRALSGHPRVGASWEGYALEQVLQIVRSTDVYYWATYQGAELDLMFVRHGRRYGVEIKYSEAPAVTKSARVAIEDLGLDHVWIVCPGKSAYPVDDRIGVVPIAAIATIGEQIGT